jgi:hypothetical protein
MRRFVLLVLVGCGSPSVDLGDGASDLGIACNKPQPVLAVTAAIPRLALAGAGSHIAVGWTADDATFGNALISLDGVARIASVARDELGHGGNYTGVSLAMADDHTILIALGMQDGHTQVVIDPGAPGTTTVQLDAPNAAVATGGTPAFALAGNDSATGKASVIGIDANGVVGSPVPIGALAARLVTTRIKDALAVVEVQSTNTCVVVPIDTGVTRTGAGIAFGARNRCTEAVAGYSDARGEALLLHHDDNGSVIGTLLHADRSLAASAAVSTGATEPRAAATTDGTWVTYATSGMVEAQHLDPTGASTKTVTLGPISDATAHGVVVTNDTAYAVWIGGGDLAVARLCE